VSSPPARFADWKTVDGVIQRFADAAVAFHLYMLTRAMQIRPGTYNGTAELELLAARQALRDLINRDRTPEAEP
jgi:hypothetical protein